MNFIALDIETTGFSPGNAEIIEIAAVKVRGGEIYQTFATLCAPLNGLHPDAMRVNGITHEMVANKPSFRELLPTVLNFLGGDLIVCHNTPFDLGFIAHYCREAGLPFAPRSDDTLTLARSLLPQLPSKSLQPVADFLGISSDGYHRAQADAAVTAKIYMKLMEMRK